MQIFDRQFGHFFGREIYEFDGFSIARREFAADRFALEQNDRVFDRIAV